MAISRSVSCVFFLELDERSVDLPPRRRCALALAIRSLSHFSPFRHGREGCPPRDIDGYNQNHDHFGRESD